MLWRWLGAIDVFSCGNTEARFSYPGDNRQHSQRQDAQCSDGIAGLQKKWAYRNNAYFPQATVDVAGGRTNRVRPPLAAITLYPN